MELPSIDENSPWLALGINLLADAIIGVSAYLRRKLVPALGRRNPRLALLPIAAITAAWILASVIAFAFAHNDIGPFYASLLLFLVPTSLFLLFMWLEFNRFWSVGVRGADREIRSGVDYATALKLVHDELAFLGTGASKLTERREFEEALMRCRQDEPIRLLLMRPDASNLEHAARRAGRDRDEYKRIVLRSLSKLAQLKADRDLHLEVRFYPQESPFRLMFIDDSVCLVSYNVYGQGDGSRFPQLHIMSRREVTRSFYYAFQSYYRQLWASSEEWNFQSYLGQL